MFDFSTDCVSVRRYEHGNNIIMYICVGGGVHVRILVFVSIAAATPEKYENVKITVVVVVAVCLP